ncbi:MAG: GDSL-type esterase/lipase family protein [Minisyncoccia bacterium]|jgi:lysophospholipase L1-like esterase
MGPLKKEPLILVLTALAVFSIGWLIWNTYRPTAIVNLDSKGTAIVAFGDSLIQGVGASEGHDFVSLLAARLGQSIVNLGKSGDTAADGLARLDDVFRYDPRIVIVLLGGNDLLHGVPIDKTFADLDKIVTTIESRGAAVLLLGVRGGLLYDSYDSRFEALAKARGTGFVPNVLAGLIGDQEYMSDEVHPNDAGYAKIADKVEPVLKEMLAGR